jgi:hypothetical protein
MASRRGSRVGFAQKLRRRAVSMRLWGRFGRSHLHTLGTCLRLPPIGGPPSNQVDRRIGLSWRIENASAYFTGTGSCGNTCNITRGDRDRGEHDASRSPTTGRSRCCNRSHGLWDSEVSLKRRSRQLLSPAGRQQGFVRGQRGDMSVLDDRFQIAAARWRGNRLE